MKASATADNRQTMCGATPATKGSKAGRNLATDALCLCATDSTATNTKVCTPATALTAASWANGQTDVKRQWQELADYCAKARSKEELTAENVRAAVAEFAREIKRPKGDDGKVSNALGLVHGTGASGCTGEKDSNKGACVYYGTTVDTAGLSSITWVANLESAANKLEAAEAAKQTVLSLQDQLLSLNQTLTHAAFMPEPPKEQQQNGKAALAATENRKKECETINKAAECKSNGNCKWDGGDAEDGNHCKLNTTAVEKQTTQTEGTGEQTSKCSDAPTEEECKKVEGKKPEVKNAVCGWIEVKCKDSSFLVHNKFFVCCCFYVYGIFLRIFT
ncbi:Trypanosomal VSG domain/Trypanosome variant surface glycoprotein C-terminal domain containing protein, putative [Trypanosoma equiperdum]|uniref:Trypanosomal VSG domain/Trypanosome variant surface glycoprotein C-terminal domain containing protein, putative n=1 Tax=Trypanosoma equiperdum TaxID=5694 RepID=A0A1G4I5M3_TRYEQ|nr:Trypanosomal VSG domain/Trypanosome variant surface glycoprotein C-terminal domain containing protein, putative [Trypanosoma equiperdum]